ncbi:MAG TPA: OmpA family protein, partial [Polyangiaceae bacterium]|nr:OmpA family protein [Polyangiaceae bacterium]
MKYVAAILFLSTAVTAGCGSDASPPPKAPTGGSVVTTSNPTPPPPPEKAGDVPTQSNINISDEIRKACGITDAEAFFSYDSANVRPQDNAVLKKLADCFMTGPLKGRELRLVGHADPRGEEEYNMVLGGRRADNVKTAIVGQGMNA